MRRYLRKIRDFLPTGVYFELHCIRVRLQSSSRMNESASKSNLAPSSGKPSTANSTGSPNGRKTRTVLVARSIPDEPFTVSPAAATSAVVNQIHSRDARSGKLAAYAALGGAEDVERFDKFLAEQRGQPSASELRAAATSPHHLVASMKRKTMSRIQLEGLDAKLSGAEPDVESRKFMQQELESDARKRREEAVTHRRWLNALPIHERVAQQRQQNALRKWRQMNRNWETFKARAAKRLGKAPQELVMSRAAAYREQREMYDALQKARPLSDKVGEDVWLVSLRDEGTRFVPVGNIFSGLFCPIRESTKLGPRVRRPLDYQENRESLGHEASRPLSKLEKRSLNLLARKKWRLRKQLEVLQPHEVEHSASSHLAVGTTDLFEWASGANEEPGSDDNDEESVRAFSANVDEASRHRRLRSYASPSSPKSLGTHQFSGPSLRIAHVADDDQESGSTPASNDIRNGNTPEARLVPLRLSFYTPVGEQEQRSLSIANDGSTIVHYQWWRAPFEHEKAELTIHVRGRRTRREEQELERLTTTSVSNCGGTLLPGETQQFVFTFESTKAGVFLEKWLFDADPRPRICIGVTPVDADAGSSVELPVEVRLSCVAEDNFVAWRQREAQLARVEQREGHFFVANLVDEILDGVRPPEPVVFNELAPRDEVTMFYEQNGSNEFSDAYFSPVLVRDCYALYERAQGILSVISLVQTPFVEGDSPSKEDAGDNGVVEGAETSKEGDLAAPPEQNGTTEGASSETELQQETRQSAPLPAHLVQEWNWRLETLRDLCKMADEAQTEQIAHLTQQLKKEVEELEEEDENEEEDDEEEEECNEETSPRLSPREVRKIERLARRGALEDEINALRPDLQETFDIMRFSAYTAPYQSTRFQERLYERLGSLCSETPAVCEIAKTMNAGSDSAVVQAAKVEGVGKLLMRAIDEAVGGDHDHQALFEQERRRIQRMWLDDKASYLSIAPWMTEAAATTSVLPPTEGTNIPPNAEQFDTSGVILMQVDLDLAPWFSLVKAETELAWRFSQELAQHATFVPVKVVQAAESLEKILSMLSGANPAVHTIVLVSELSRPPLSKQMYKLLRSAAQEELKGKVLATNPVAGETEESKTQGGEQQGEDAEEALMNILIQRLSSQLSLRSVAPVVQRATQRDVVFCSAVEEVQGQIEVSRKELVLHSSVSLGGGQTEVPVGGDEAEANPQGAGASPRILLLEHLDAVGIDLITHASRKRELSPLKPATPAPSEAHKPAAGGKKPSVAVPAKGKPGTLGAPASSAPVENPPSSIPDLTQFEFAGKDLSDQGIKALRNQFARMVSTCVMDGIPSQACESVFVFTPKPDDTHSPPVTFAGPTLSKELETWSKALQPMLPCTALSVQPRVLTAVVGGKSLETKLRLIDGLLEFVHEIYFVGDVAMSLYRVLHTKQVGKPAGGSHIGMKREEEGEELEEDADVFNVDGGAELLKEETPEEEANELSNEKGTNETLPPGRACSMGLWELLVPAVEKIQQKASRKCVRLLLPIDFIVGDAPLEEQDLTAGAVFEDDEDDDEDEEDEEEEEEEGDGRKRRTSELKSASQKPLVEPVHADVFEQKRQGAYEGERSHVVLNYASSRRLTSSDAGWRTFQDITTQYLSNARVTEGKPSVLASLWSESEGDEADEEGDDGAMHKPSPPRFEYEWTFRALDVGPIAMESLGDLLKQGTGSEDHGIATDLSTQSRALIINGVCGAVEFHEFCAATKHLLAILRGYSPSQVFIAGSSTASWLRQLEIEQLNNVAAIEEKRDARMNSAANVNSSIIGLTAPVRKVIDDRTLRNARVLKQLVAAKPHPILASLASADLI
ncbi:hypothetical protein PHYPSEUDO_006914 [Phytophthora pseudosyringae]|uniref:Phosphoglycerate kinase n=1 Tax=Phytophthora pseudosyringae TaxID=221518 RepID=A0A8T1VHJ1_9STRA|nr:hypothetical protein PHYPSEUDO_006914 [Phytophthora pseudosyringae]